MKKLVIASALVAFAAVANAASFNWKVTNVRIPVANDVTVSQSGITVSSANTAFAANTLTLVLSYADSSDNWIQLAAGLNDSGATKSSAEAFNDTTAAAIVTAAGGTSIDLLLTATYETADGIYEFSMTESGYDISNVSGNVSNLTKTFAMNKGTWNYTANSIPEPTSGLLLLLGVAGLALRRKKA